VRTVKTVMVRLRISLARSIAPVWREVEISERASLALCGQALALLFFDYLSDGEFTIDGRRFPVGEDDDWHAVPALPLLADVLQAPGQRFGFSRSCDTTWVFDVEYAARLESSESAPICVGGAGAMPTDEFNNIENFNDYCRALAAPKAQPYSGSDRFLEDVEANRDRWLIDFGLDLANDRLREINPTSVTKRSKK
jgi:hypothetical protein